MTSVSSPNSFLKINYGIQVIRATSSLPATTDLTLFNVTGGRIVLTSLVGQVTTVIQTQACNIKLKSVPTTGTSGDISGVLNISAFEVGSLISADLSGALTAVMLGVDAHVTPLKTGALLVPIGGLKLNTSATNTGAIQWTATYFPYDSGAAIAAA